MQPPYEPIDHTADAGFLVRGRSLEDLFRNGALCLFEQLGDTAGAARSTTRDIEVRAEGHAALFRAWLSEILYVSYVGKLVLVDAEVLELTTDRLRARVSGESYDEARHERNPEIKAVTWHDLAVRPTAAGFEAVFILDL